jgi:hypothetical protein
MFTAACSPTGRAINDYCLVAEPIYISKKDGLTNETARQVLQNNETGLKLCGWGEE